MRFLVDTNILVYAASESYPQHSRSAAFLNAALSDGVVFCITWHIAYEFLRIMTHRRILPRPLTAAKAYTFLAALFDSGQVVVLAETDRHADMLRRTLAEMRHPAGNLLHDIHTAVLMREHGIPQIVTAVADFSRFPFLQTVNPLVT